MNTGKYATIALTVFITTTFSCAQQRTSTERIAQLPDKVKVAAVQIVGYYIWIVIKEGLYPV